MTKESHDSKFSKFWHFFQFLTKFRSNQWKIPKKSKNRDFQNFRKIFEFFFRISIFKFTCFVNKTSKKFTPKNDEILGSKKCQNPWEPPLVHPNVRNLIQRGVPVDFFRNFAIHGKSLINRKKNFFKFSKIWHFFFDFFKFLKNQCKTWKIVKKFFPNFWKNSKNRKFSIFKIWQIYMFCEQTIEKIDFEKTWKKLWVFQGILHCKNLILKNLMVFQ